MGSGSTQEEASVNTQIDNKKLRRQRQAAIIAEQASAGSKTLIIKIILIGLLDALAIYAILTLWAYEQWIIMGAVLITALLLNWIYFSKRTLPSKYLAPGVVFLIIFQVFTMIYTVYISTTNYGTHTGGGMGDKERAIQATQLYNVKRVEGTPMYPIKVVEKDGKLGFLATVPEPINSAPPVSDVVVDENGEEIIVEEDIQLSSGGAIITDEFGNDVEVPPGTVLLGFNGERFKVIHDAEIVDGRAVSAPGVEVLTMSQIMNRQKEIREPQLAVMFTEDVTGGALTTQEGQQGRVSRSIIVYDAETDTMTNVDTGVVYHDSGSGYFVSDNGERPNGGAGWIVSIGFDNYLQSVTNEVIRGPLLAVTIWTFVFAFLSVATTFFLGLFLAIVFQDPRMKSKKYYRVIMILPYAFPSFLSALVWANMMNTTYGFINDSLLGGLAIPWLTDPVLAKVSVLLVNLWLGFPYMFLVSMGALQSIPDDVVEAATVDGAKPWAIFRLIKLPLLLVTVAPLLISSFAFNFNNFNLIYMLTDGGPSMGVSGFSVGHTDILISMVYKVAFVGTSNFGLAAAFSILIFIVVGTVSVIALRKTKALEELN